MNWRTYLTRDETAQLAVLERTIGDTRAEREKLHRRARKRREREKGTDDEQ